jgi:hypothetical protein
MNDGMNHGIGIGRIACLIVSLAFHAMPARGDEPLPEVVQFNRDVRPILSDHCFACHGPDKNKREADLRLDQQAGLVGTPDAPGVVLAGDREQSELWRRILTADSDERMPPPEFGKELSPRQREILGRWIDQGAPWQGHWAFQPVIAPVLPPAAPLQPAPHPVDTLVRDALRKQSMEPSPEADRVTLIRRLSFDLLGLPPTPAEVQTFLADPRGDAYERLVDRLLASPHYGERMAQWWLDLVRYADTVGYHGDQPMSVSPFRDYVIRSFNENKPFDQFTVEQLAGDLLPSPTIEQRVASGYNRLGMMSAEGGVQPKEYLAKYIAERVRNVSGTWLGVTLGCAECHDHKYDPFTTRDFYAMEAFFADIQEQGLYSGSEGTGVWGPSLQLPTDEQSARREQLRQELTAAQASLQAETPERIAAQQAWEQSPGAPESLPEPVRQALAVAVDARTPEQKTTLANHFRATAPLLAGDRDRVQKLEADLAALERTIPVSLVTSTVAPRMVRVLARGNWMDESGAEVQPATPGILPGTAPREQRLNRLDLAQWLVRRDNPLTARVFVNRLWKQYFGSGLSRKLDDLGAQGETPSHPELLDHLAAAWMDSGWNVKQLVRYIVLSETYRQSSVSSEAQRQLDPYNRWLARQGRFRLEAELVRDNALAVSGLLVQSIGGPSVKPYQPPGYWAYLNFPTREWENGRGQDLYRRGLYTHWQRQYLHPALLAFDAPSREECTAERPRSNTPLQSLVLLNDPCYVEAARKFAERMMLEGGTAAEDRIRWAFQQALSRLPNASELAVLRQLQERHLADYTADPAAAQEATSVGEHPVPEGISRAELASWISVTRTILNLHETITRN